MERSLSRVKRTTFGLLTSLLQSPLAETRPPPSEVELGRDVAGVRAAKSASDLPAGFGPPEDVR